MKRITILGLLAATTATTSPILIADPTGTYAAFTLDSLPGHFAYNDDLRKLVALAGNIDEGFALLGQNEIFGTDIYFNEAQIDKDGNITDVSGEDHLKLGRKVLKLDLGETLAQLAMADIGQKEKVSLRMGDQTKFMREPRGATDLVVFKLGDQIYGVYETAAKMISVRQLELQPDGHYVSKQTIGTFVLTDVKASIVDLANVANQSASTDAGHDAEKRVAA
jgi:hypothetical protein